MTQYICKSKHISATPQPQLLFCHTCDGPVEPVSDALPFIEPEPEKCEKCGIWDCLCDDENHKSMKAKRIQRSRKAGWRKPENTVNVTRPGKWGNPFNWQAYKYYQVSPGGKPNSPKLCKELSVKDFKRTLTPEKIASIKRELKNKDLMCWCKESDPCHGDVLLEIANSYFST